MRKIFSYISKVLLFIGVVYAEPDSKVEALEGRKQESSLDKKIRQELKNKDLKNEKEEKKNPEEKKEVKPKRKPRAEVHHGDTKNPTQKITPSKIKEGTKGVQNQGVQNNAPKPEEKDATPQATEKNKETSPSSQFNSIFGNPNNATNNTLEDKVVGGISLLVNGSPITLYQIQEEQKKSKVSKAQARDRLIAERIKNQEI
ncbi:SurA protein, partial [Helicobacter pylori]